MLQIYLLEHVWLGKRNKISYEVTKKFLLVILST